VIGVDFLPYSSTLPEYQKHAEALLEAVKAHDEAAEWRFKWMLPRFRGRPISEVRAASLELADAQLVLAREYGFEIWADLADFADVVSRDGSLQRFEAAVDAVVAGDTASLWAMLQEHPELARARSTRRHRATLLHYVAANGVEHGRQKTPANAVEVAKLLLDAGAGVDAVADMYDHQCTTMSMLVSSCHPANAGLQAALAETLLDYGAAFAGPGTNWQSTLMTALAFGYLDTATALAARGAPVDNIAAAAGLGRLEDAERLLPSADNQNRHIALALAAQHGHAEVVRLLLEAGEDPNRFNPEGFHSHATPLHQAALYGHIDIVRLLAERGARLDIQDTAYRSTPLGWAIHGQKTAVADYLRERDAPKA
jgi:ankyrin repeat protein